MNTGFLPIDINNWNCDYSKNQKQQCSKHLKLEKLKENLRRWRIFHFTNRNIFRSIFVRGDHEVVRIIADGFVEFTHENSIVAKGVQFLDNEWLRNLLTIQQFCTIGILKGVSYGGTKFWDICAVDPSSQFCD